FSFVPGVGAVPSAGTGTTTTTGGATGSVKLSQIDQVIDERGFPNLRNFVVANQVAIDFAHNLSNADILANPRIRVKNREAAKIHIGTRQPVFSASVAGGGISNVVTSTPTFIEIGT